MAGESSPYPAEVPHRLEHVEPLPLERLLVDDEQGETLIDAHLTGSLLGWGA